MAAVLLASTSLAVGAGTACSKEGKAFAVLMDSAPKATGRFTYWAIGDLNEDEDLWVVYDRFKGSPDAGQLKELVQVLDVVKDSARVVGSDNAAVSKGPVTVLRAKFDRKLRGGPTEHTEIHAVGLQRREHMGCRRRSILQAGGSDVRHHPHG